jgi:hypothetical protein
VESIDWVQAGEKSTNVTSIYNSPEHDIHVFVIECSDDSNGALWTKPGVDKWSSVENGQQPLDHYMLITHQWRWVISVKENQVENIQNNNVCDLSGKNDTFSEYCIITRSIYFPSILNSLDYIMEYTFYYQVYMIQKYVEM